MCMCAPGDARSAKFDVFPRQSSWKFSKQSIQRLGRLTKLQTVQNAAARVVTGTKKFDPITPVLHRLHWLPVRQRVTFSGAKLLFSLLCQIVVVDG